jgi:hypothetical protein
LWWLQLSCAISSGHYPNLVPGLVVVVAAEAGGKIHHRAAPRRKA